MILLKPQSSINQGLPGNRPFTSSPIRPTVSELLQSSFTFEIQMSLT